MPVKTPQAPCIQVNSCCGVHQEVLIFEYLLIAHQASYCQVHINVLGLELDHWHKSLGETSDFLARW